MEGREEREAADGDAEEPEQEGLSPGGEDDGDVGEVRAEARTARGGHPGPGTVAPSRCPCSRCNYECCLLAHQQRPSVDVDALAMELRLFVASQERMALDVRQYREQRAEAARHGGGGGAAADLITDQFHAVASCLEEMARRAPTESCEHLAGTLGEMMGLRAALGPVVDSVLVSGLHRLRDLRRRTGTPLAPGTPGTMASEGSITPMSAQEHHHHAGNGAAGALSNRARFVTFPSEASPGSRLAEEWRAVLGTRARAAVGTPRQRPYASECLRPRPALSSECLRAPHPAPAPHRALSDPDVASTVASSRALSLSMDAERPSVSATWRSSSVFGVQRSRSRSRVTLASLSLSLPSAAADSGLAQSGSRASGTTGSTGCPSTGAAVHGSDGPDPGSASAGDDSGDVVRAAVADKPVSSEERERFDSYDFKEDPGVCAFFGGRVHSGGRGSAARRRPSGEATATSGAGMGVGLGDVDVAWPEGAADATLLTPEALSFGDDDEDLKALREEIERKAAGVAPPTTELYSAQDDPQRSVANLFGDHVGDIDTPEGPGGDGGPGEDAGGEKAGEEAGDVADDEAEVWKEAQEQNEDEDENAPVATTCPGDPTTAPGRERETTGAIGREDHGRPAVPSTPRPPSAARESSTQEAAAAAPVRNEDLGARAGGVGGALVRIASSPFQMARALLGPAVHFRPPSKDVIPRCLQAQAHPPATAPAPPPHPLPGFDFLRGGLHWPDLGFVFGRTIHQAAADSIREMAQHDLGEHREGRHRVRGRSCSVLSHVPEATQPPSDGDQDQDEEGQ